jgi:hypothetical protein
VVVEAYLWERDAAVPTKKAFRCGICARDGRALLIEPIGPEDEERTLRLEDRGLAYWQLVERFPNGSSDLGGTLASLYTPRNLAALMATARAVETALPAGDAREVMRLCLVEVIVAGSKLNAVAGQGAPLRIDKGRAKRGHASQFREINVWLEYERTVRELASWLAGHRPPVGARAPFGDAPVGAADLVLAQVPLEDTFGGWAQVAGTILGLGGRAIDAAEGKVSARERMLRTTRHALLDAHRTTGDAAIAVMYVPHADLGALAAVALAGAGAGWKLASILYQPDALGGPAGPAAILELDRDSAPLREQAAADATAMESVIRGAIRDTIVARGGPIEAERAGAAALEALSARGLLAPLALARGGGVSELEVFMDHFRSALADAQRDGVDRVGDSVARYDIRGVGADRSPLDDRVEWSVWGLLASAREIDTRSVLRRTYALFRGAETPDRELVERCLASYGAQGDGGRWRLHERDALAQRQIEQTALAAHLIDAGHRLRFKVHVGKDLVRRTLPEPFAARGELLGDLMTSDERGAPTARHVRGSADALSFVDVMWYDRGRMVFLWQIDWTARLHRSVVDIGEAIPDDERVFRFVAIPEERKGLAVLKLTRSPSLADAVRARGWRLVKWGPLRAFAADPDARLDGLEPVLGLEPAVERSAHQLSFQW